MDNLSVLFYISASNGIGLGHLVRCHAMATTSSLPKISDKWPNFDITFAADDQELTRKVVGDNYTVISPTESENNTYDIIITDYLELSLEKQQTLKSRCKLLVGINDSDLGPFAFDLVFRPNILDIADPEFSHDNGKTYKGTDYILLNPLYGIGRTMDDEFKTEYQDRPESITICFGGSDPANLTLRTVKALADILPHTIIHVVTGAGYAHLDELNKVLKTTDVSKFVHHHNLSSLAALLQVSKCALISGGTLLYECCACGTPAIIIGQNQEQCDETSLFADKGAVLNLGTHHEVDELNITNEVAMLMKNDDQLERMNKAAEKLIDGTGTIKTLELILEEYKK